MSWGERSCVVFGKCDIANEKICNVDCLSYRCNGEPPDSVAKFTKSDMPPKEPTEPKEKQVQMVQSTFPNFSKTKEFIVLKGHIFHIQSVSPKKLVLKLKGKDKKLPNGIFALKEV